MKAITRSRYGGAEVLELRELPLPTLGPRDVLVRVEAAGLDRGVVHLMTGLPSAVRLAIGPRAPRRIILGLDVAGTVESVGAAVTTLRPGDRVVGTADGAFAQYARTDERRLVLRSAGLPAEVAAALPVSGCTALQALRATGALRAGERVLVLGAAGGVGSLVTQLAVEAGARVTGVASAGKLDFVRSLGAEEALDYAAPAGVDGDLGGGGFDVIVDTGGNRPLRELRRLLTPRGRLAIVGGEGLGGPLGGAGRQLRAALLSPLVRQRLRGVASRPTRADLEVLRELVESGRLVPAVDRVVPLEDAAEAIRSLEAGAVRGKLVLRVSQP
jgi:NADPH:quinone reductase-like Zn-dependent oxidoreductase